MTTCTFRLGCFYKLLYGTVLNFRLVISLLQIYFLSCSFHFDFMLSALIPCLNRKAIKEFIIFSLKVVIIIFIISLHQVFWEECYRYWVNQINLRWYSGKIHQFWFSRWKVMLVPSSGTIFDVASITHIFHQQEQSWGSRSS